jgi:hypothetical protein
MGRQQKKLYFFYYTFYLPALHYYSFRLAGANALMDGDTDKTRNIEAIQEEREPTRDHANDDEIELTDADDAVDADPFEIPLPDSDGDGNGRLGSGRGRDDDEVRDNPIATVPTPSTSFLSGFL